jgi:hypothetical protein
MVEKTPRMMNMDETEGICGEMGKQDLPGLKSCTGVKVSKI